MPNITSVLNEQIRRLAKREIKANTGVIRKATTQYRHAIAALKKQVAALTKRLAVVEKHAPKEIAVPSEVLEKGRFRAIGVKAHRSKLDLSAKDYGKLVGVAGITIYQWESGKSTPQAAQKAKWLAIRGLGKREALERLGMAEPKVALGVAAKLAPRKIGKGKLGTAQEFVLSLLQGKPLLTAQVNAAWTKAKRAGRANKTLGLLVKGKKLKRVKVAGERGSAYTIASGHQPVIAAVKLVTKPAVKPAKFAAKSVVKSVSRQSKKRGQFEQTAEELILSLLKGKTLTTKELAAEWKKAGKGGAVDNPLGRMVKAGKLKRKPLGGKKGSEYRVG